MKSKPKDLPGLKEYVCSVHQSQMDKEPENETRRAMLEQCQHASMLWVSEEMTLVTSAAQQTLPPETENYPSSESGIVLFDGGTGITASLDYFPETYWQLNSFGSPIMPRVEINGVFWCQPSDSDQPLYFGVSAYPKLRNSVEPSVKTLLVDLSDQDQRKVSLFMRSMWLLIAQKGMTEQQEQAVIKGGGKKSVKTQTQRNNTVRIISLKRHKREYQPTKDAKGKWQLGHQILVSGHWKNQPYGPRDEGLRRPQYIRPYIKGPDGTKLVIRPTVKVWS